MTIKGPVRYIENAEIFSGFTGCNHGAGSVALTLNCGHVKHIKKSQWLRMTGLFTKCIQCPLDEDDYIIPKTAWTD